MVLPNARGFSFSVCVSCFLRSVSNSPLGSGQRGEELPGEIDPGHMTQGRRSAGVLQSLSRRQETSVGISLRLVWPVLGFKHPLRCRIRQQRASVDV